jgi:GAF domain-containing protein
MSSDARSDALRVLAEFLVAESTLGETLQRVSEITIDALPGAEIAGITMLDERGQATTAVFTDPDSPEIDQGQYESGRGPCLDAWRRKEVVRVPDMHEAADEYPEFSSLALEHGVLSTLSLPLVAAGKGIGALNLYSRQQNGFTEADAELGEDLATAASIVLANASAYWQVFELSEHLQRAMDSRAVIDQAKGILMARTAGLDADAAFAILARASQRENVKVREIARRIIDGEAPPAPDQGA